MAPRPGAAGHDLAVRLRNPGPPQRRRGGSGSRKQWTGRVCLPSARMTTGNCPMSRKFIDQFRSPRVPRAALATNGLPMIQRTSETPRWSLRSMRREARSREAGGIRCPMFVRQDPSNPVQGRGEVPFPRPAALPGAIRAAPRSAREAIVKCDSIQRLADPARRRARAGAGLSGMVHASLHGAASFSAQNTARSVMNTQPVGLMPPLGAVAVASGAEAAASSRRCPPACAIYAAGRSAPPASCAARHRREPPP